jgi:hypothetical protein
MAQTVTQYLPTPTIDLNRGKSSHKFGLLLYLCKNPDQSIERQFAHSGTDFMIFKIFSPKNFAKKLDF